MTDEKTIVNSLLHSYFMNLCNDSRLHKELDDIAVIKKYAIKEKILDMGERTDDVCLILKGLVRGYYIDYNGNDITKCFSKEMDWCCSYSFFNNDPSPFFLETLEETILARLNIVKCQKIMKAYPKVESAIEQLIHQTLLESEKRIYLFTGMEAKDRYVNFINENLELAARVRQEYIASYLGITPSSLSRIKRNI